MKTLRVPFQIDSRGGLAVTESTQQIVEQQIIDILMTNDFERVMNPTYGSNLRGFLFSPVASALLTVKAEEIKTELNVRVQLADIKSVSATEMIGRTGTVQITVLYTISPSPTVFEMTRTVSGLVTTETFGEVI